MTYKQYYPNPISFNVFIQRSNNERFLCKTQATENDDHANANQLYDTAGAYHKDNDLQSKLF